MVQGDKIDIQFCAEHQTSDAQLRIGEISDSLVSLALRNDFVTY
jgi:hypothetical protein